MKTILPWFLVALTAGGAVFFYNGNQAKSAEVARLQAQAQEVEALRTELEALKKDQVAPEELARLKEAKDEVLRLRNQVRQLTQQAQTAQTAAAQAQVQAQAQVEAQALVMAKAREEMAATMLQGCQNQLRQIQSAKQSWALDHQKPAETVPTDRDLAPYLPGQMIPTCPGGGRYALGAVAVLPTCSAPGHALPPAQ